MIGQPPAEDLRTVTLSRAEFQALAHDAESWRTLNSSPHVAELLAEWGEWSRRTAMRQASGAVCAALDWRAFARVPTYAELERRRAEPVTPRRCGARDCRMVLSVPWPAPRHDVFCSRHEDDRSAAA
ncbi:hypothetical protein BS329_39930 [Amycolatopsis coloradensis]|uniref:Uncharacterized protein n=1 Tax=Amycolatopsis coloradensis TaxID=76021 RepID=A0A1R0KDY9_9PSEU|nr:hypothetical protein [Amycolatopsis coloradensis]OLZ43260.1 hypothetical protein BS329_39930 [Amycolatopsis coloradensis]